MVRLPAELKLRSVIENISYKPNFSFAIYPHLNPDSGFPEYSDLCLLITMRVPDVSCPRCAIDVKSPVAVSARMVDELEPDGIVEHIIRPAIRAMELHEMDEWLKFEGRHVHDPHANNFR